MQVEGVVLKEEMWYMVAMSVVGADKSAVGGGRRTEQSTTSSERKARNQDPR